MAMDLTSMILLALKTSILLTVFGLALKATADDALYRAHREGRREYGLLANLYVDEFRAKWMRGKRPEGEPLAGSVDIQSLADLRNSFDVVQDMDCSPSAGRASFGLRSSSRSRLPRCCSRCTR